MFDIMCPRRDAGDVSDEWRTGVAVPNFPSLSSDPTEAPVSRSQEFAESGTWDLLRIDPGKVASLNGEPGSGLTRVGLVMLAGHADEGPVAYLDVRGWLSPLAAWEVGIEPDRLVVVRCTDVVRWGRAVAALLDGTRAVYAEVPGGVKDAVIRKLGALARSRRTPLVLRSLAGSLPAGIAHLVLEVKEVTWEGAEQGHGRLRLRRSVVVASGKAMRGMSRTIELEDDGSNALHLVPGVGITEVGRAAG